MSADDPNVRERLIVIGEIATEIAHELRNVIQVIAASAYLARQDPASSMPHIQKIERNARLAHAVVDDLMALARGEPMHVEPVFFAEVLVAARSDFPPESADWNDAVTPHDLRVRAHPGLLARVLHALYDNSIAVCAPRKPSITTRAWSEGAPADGSEVQGRVVIEVADDGPGVPSELAPKIFEPLVTGRAGGTGLGLALAQRVAVAHGGTIALAPSEKGATFRIEFPLTRAK